MPPPTPPASAAGPLRSCLKGSRLWEQQQPAPPASALPLRSCLKGSRRTEEERQEQERRTAAAELDKCETGGQAGDHGQWRSGYGEDQHYGQAHARSLSSDNDGDADADVVGSQLPGSPVVNLRLPVPRPPPYPVLEPTTEAAAFGTLRTSVLPTSATRGLDRALHRLDLPQHQATMTATATATATMKHVLDQDEMALVDVIAV